MKKMFRLTKDGVVEMQHELDNLIAQRSEIADRIKTAREFGDLSENAEYSSARADQEKNETRISEIENILKNVEIIKAPRGGGKKVQLGAKVKLKGGGTTKEFQIVGTVEADPLVGKISDESPIGQALLGKKEGDQVEIKTMQDTIQYRIMTIS